MNITHTKNFGIIGNAKCATQTIKIHILPLKKNTMICVVSLEDAKRLKEQGYSKPCEYYYLDVDLPFCEKGLKKN